MADHVQVVMLAKVLKQVWFARALLAAFLATTSAHNANLHTSEAFKIHLRHGACLHQL